MAIQDIIIGAAAIQRSIPGIQTAFDDVPTSLNQLPCFVTYPSDGQPDWPRVIGRRRIEHNIDMDLYVQKGGDLQASDRLAKSFIDLVIDTFDQNITLGGSCTTSGVVDYHYGKMMFTGVEYIGIKFTLKAIEFKQVVFKG